jgi:hypothetical protein
MHADLGSDGQDGFSFTWPATNRVPGKRTPWLVARSSSSRSRAPKVKPSLPTRSRRQQKPIMLTYGGWNGWVKAGDAVAARLGVASSRGCSDAPPAKVTRGDALGGQGGPSRLNGGARAAVLWLGGVWFRWRRQGKSACEGVGEVLI